MVKIIKPAKGTFTTANITIDSSGRVITASSGAGGDGSFYPRVSAKGPASGNVATPANATKYYAYAFSGGGGGGGRSATNQASGGGGGTSNATATIMKDTDAGATGTLVLSNVSGTFEDDEIITDDNSSAGSARVNGSAGGAVTSKGKAILRTLDISMGLPHGGFPTARRMGGK
mgnify:CR=1 FL=1